MRQAKTIRQFSALPVEENWRSRPTRCPSIVDLKKKESSSFIPLTSSCSVQLFLSLLGHISCFSGRVRLLVRARPPSEETRKRKNDETERLSRYCHKPR